MTAPASLLFCFVLFQGALLAQNTGEYTPTRTAQHRQAPGTHVWIVPPKGFVQTENDQQQGFYKDAFNYIRVEEIPGNSYTFLFAGRRGLVDEYSLYTYQAEREYRINALRACEMQYTDTGTPRSGHHVLLIGNEQYAAVVSFYFRQPQTSIDAVAACLRSVYVDPNDIPDHLAPAALSLDLAGSGYGLAHQAGNIYIFSPGGSIKPEDLPGFLLLVANDWKAPEHDSLHPMFHQQALIAALERYPSAKANIPAQTTTFKGFPALETQLDLSDTGHPERIYVLTIHRPRWYYVLVAMAQHNPDTEMPRLRQVIQRLNFR